jgi:uncharacterized protein
MAIDKVQGRAAAGQWSIAKGAGAIMADIERVDLGALDAFLLSNSAAENGMGLSDLDGFLTGIVVGPELLMPSEWLPVIWGGDEPDFADMIEARAILGTIMDRYNEIIAHLDADPPVVHPVFSKGPRGEGIVTDWAAGFVDAMKLREKAWEPLLQHKVARALIVPLLVLGADDEDHPPFGQPPLSPKEIAVLHAGGAKMIPLCVVGIRAFWQDHVAQSAPKSPRDRRRPENHRRRR